MKIAVVSSNLGNFDRPMEYVAQSVPYDFHLFTDSNFPPRYRSMTPRLQARIPKCFSWQMLPGYDYYIWVDSSFALLHPDSVKWFVEQCDGMDMAVLGHPIRHTIKEEAEYLKLRLVEEKQNPEMDQYVTLRYDNELIDDQLKEINSNGMYVDDCLYASTAFAYRNRWNVQEALKEWWYHISRYHAVDQLALPYVLWKYNCRAKVIPTSRNSFSLPYMTLTRYRQ